MAVPPFRIDQLGIVVADLDAALPVYDELLRAESWSIWTYGPHLLHEQTFRGAPAPFEMRVALSNGLPVQVELIEPIGGPNVYDDWLASRGPGLHHLGTFESDLPSGRRVMSGLGYAEAQLGLGQGADGTGGFVYFDATRTLGYYLELIERPGERHPPEAVWRRPAEDEA